MIFVHGSNLQQKEQHPTKYRDEISVSYLREIRAMYDKWSADNQELIGPTSTKALDDFKVIERRVELLEAYKNFIDQQKYAEQFDSRSNLHSSVLEEFLYYLFRDLVNDFGNKALLGKSHTFKDIFFMPQNYRSMINKPNATIERKDHDFVIGVRVKGSFMSVTEDEVPLDIPQDQLAISEVLTPYNANQEETHYFDIPAVVIECKTYLDKTMLEGSSRAAEELKARNPNGLYIVVMEWLKLTEDINLKKYKVDQIYVFRRQKNTDREYRYLPDYVKKPIDPRVIHHLFEMVRNHLISDWKGGINFGLERGWLV